MRGENIRVKFLNGDLALHNRIRAVADQWMQYANVRFTYVGLSEEADIQIGIKWGGNTGSGSVLGTACRLIPQGSPTMNFGWFDSSTSDEEIRRTTLHEFGHALGLGHEHQNPIGNIQWNIPVVYNYFLNTQGWNQAEVDRNVLNRANINTTNFTSYDPESIMLYFLPAFLTTNGYSTANNTVLSNTDKSFIRATYPSSPTRNILYEGEQLNQGQELVSSNGRYKLRMQGDGNLVMYNGSENPIWHSGTWGENITYASMQRDGQFVIYDNTNTPRWHSNTWTRSGSHLVMEDNGNLIIYQAGVVRWSSNTQNQRIAKN
jgi:hypothetical protein